MSTFAQMYVTCGKTNCHCIADWIFWYRDSKVRSLYSSDAALQTCSGCELALEQSYRKKLQW